MNTGSIKAYAPKARNNFIAAMSKQAAKYGITENAIEPGEVKGDLLIIGGKPFPLTMAKPREALIHKIQLLGFAQVMEQVAYSWFNRLCAIRYMELADYLGHGRRVLSHPQQNNQYQILDECLDIDLPGLNQAKARELKLDGSKDEELYRMLLLAQCHALYSAMPFLFEPVDDESELLLPDNLTKTDSLIRDLVDSIPEQDWANIEIIGWLYQFYISEKKDQVIGKVVKSEDIPAATQLFTPNWIVKYMVQNSLGAQWLATYPQSPLKGQMEYYIEPAEQTDEVNEQLAEITPDELNPEELTLIDPASGSGHILVEAYELFKAIYLERGYRQRDIAQLILEKNLFGLDIDERAVQLTGFALMMKGRADDRRLFEKQVKLNVMALVDSAGFDAEALANGVKLADYGLESEDLTALERLFEHATTFGSLIQVPEGLAGKLPGLRLLSEVVSQDLFVSEALEGLGVLVRQGEVLAGEYDAVVANPPYMGSKHMGTRVKGFARDHFPHAKSDLFACFMDRSYTLSKDEGHTSLVTMQSWMFLSSFESLREVMLREKTIETMAQIGFNSFPSMNSKIAMATVFSTANYRVENFVGTFIDLNSAPHSANKQAVFLARSPSDQFQVAAEEFKKIPGSPIAYWASNKIRGLFQSNSALCSTLNPKQGSSTGDDETYVRYWNEINYAALGIGFGSQHEAHESGKKYFPFDKGGEIRKWFGNNDKVLRYDLVSYEELLLLGNHLPSRDLYFKPGITWSKITLRMSVRFDDPGFIFSSVGLKGFPKTRDMWRILGYMNTNLVNLFTGILSPTLSVISGDIEKLPDLRLGDDDASLLEINVRNLVSETKSDWNAYERSWDFQSPPILTAPPDPAHTLESNYTTWITQNRETIAEMKRLEEENNRLFIDAYGLQDELTPDVPIEQITLTVNPAYRYGGKLSEDELWTRFREDTMEELISYAIGCMMGRYSLSRPGLVYAHSGNKDFEVIYYDKHSDNKIFTDEVAAKAQHVLSKKMGLFSPDEDGIIPITDTEWFDDDAANRLEAFISVALDKSQLEQNLNFLADNLSPKKGEGSRDTIRRYLSNQFFKDHLQTYKKRPIYWLFSSGKEKAFQCLVYLHRYNESTLSRMRTEYVIPLTSKLATHVNKLEKDKDAASSTTEIKKLEKEIARLHKQQAELSSFDEKLRHYADRRIHLDLDDGVKVNYGKFGNLLAEVKAIHGKAPDSSGR